MIERINHYLISNDATIKMLMQENLRLQDENKKLKELLLQKLLNKTN